VRAFVAEAIKIETCIGAVEPLDTWKRNYADNRISRIEDLAKQENRVSSSDIETMKYIAAIIKAEPGIRIYIHGDFNPPNIMTEFKQSGAKLTSVKFIDPSIANDHPEANWRHFTLIPRLAEELAAEYSLRSHHPTNMRLLYAIGALTHLYMGIANPQDAELRRRGLSLCLSKLR
jgi:fructosamine-3-kinase